MKKIIGFVLMIFLGMLVVSCGSDKKEDGSYAIYQLAKENNFEGTYEEWLESIKGDKVVLSVIGDELKWKYSKEDDSSYKTLVKLSALKGADGKDGKDAKFVKDITSVKVGDATIFTFIFSDNTEIKTELIDKKETIRTVKSTLKEIDAYKIYKYSSDSKYYDIYLDKPEFQLGKVNLRFVENESLVPYISLDEMVKLYNVSLTSTEYKSTTAEVDGNSIWTLKNNSTIKGTVKIDPVNQEFVIDGNFGNAFTNPIDYSKYSLFLGAKYNSSIVKDAETKTVLSYKNTDFTTFKEDGVNYYPFGLLNMVLQNYTNRKYFYNYVNLYEYNEFEQLN